MTATNKIQTPYGFGDLCDRLEDGMITVRLPVNELTLSIPKERFITKGESMGVWKFFMEELK